MFNKKRWWSGLIVGVAIALGLLVAVALSEIAGDIQSSNRILLLFTLGSFVACLVSLYTGFGKGRADHEYYSSRFTRSFEFPPSYGNAYVAEVVPPCPLLGGVATGYAVITVMAWVTCVMWVFY